MALFLYTSACIFRIAARYIYHITNFIDLTFSQDKKKYLKARESIIADFFNFPIQIINTFIFLSSWYSSFVFEYFF